MFPPALYINRDEDGDRRLHMESQFAQIGLTDYSRFSAFTGAPEDIFINYGQVDLSNKTVRQVSRAVLSHLFAIKSLEFKDSNCAFIFEDDAVLTTAARWPFSWREFVGRLPENWGAVQLYRNPMSKQELSVKKYRPDMLSTLAYAISKKHAERVVDSYFVGDRPDFKALESAPMHIGPYLTDRVIYTPESYSVNLFSTATFSSTILPEVPDGYHQNSKDVVYLWENQPASLDQLFEGVRI